MIEAASEAVIVEPALRAAAELEVHEQVATPDMWDPAGHIVAHDRHREAERAAAARTTSLRSLGATLIAAGRSHEARRVESALRDPAVQAATRRDGALALARTQRFADALNALGRQALDDWIAALAAWLPGFEQVEPGAGRRILQHVIDIASWSRPGWATVSQRLPCRP